MHQTAKFNHSKNKEMDKLLIIWIVDIT